MEFNWQDFVNRVIKYLLEGLVVAMAAYLVFPARRKNGWEDFVLLGLTASATFAVLDIGLTPSIASTARRGAGFGLGAGVVGWPAGVRMA